MPIGVATDKEAGRRWRRSIREVLNTEWDPIGASELSPDEYDGYTGWVAATLRVGASGEGLSDYLHWAGTVHMGMPGDVDRLNKVVASIRSLGWMQ